MTDTLPPASTQPAPPSCVFTFDKHSAKDAGLKIKPKKEEEADGSIRCICTYSDDDGNTIFCEECKTWQHIACYYPGRETEVAEDQFAHSCADCKPRELDRQRAHEQMKAKLGFAAVGSESLDKKSKRPPSKSHKKKTKPTDLQLNGYAANNDGSKHGSPHDLHPAKKAKTSHKSSHSISTSAAKRSPSNGATTKVNHNGHPLSPATTPPNLPADFEHPSAVRFLVRHGTPFEPADTNIIATLETTNKMAVWSRTERPDFRNDAGAELDEVVLRKTPSTLSPPLRVDKQEHQVPGGPLLHWPRLITPSPIGIDVPMMELNGVVGLQSDYCEVPENRYKDLSAPLPFVFFPEHIPLYIDARREGSNARHVRRSCKPNARLATYLPDDSGWHFWLVSDRPIDANEEITLGWDFHLAGNYDNYMKRLLGLHDEATNEQSVTDVVTDIDQKDYNFLDQWIDLLMAEYGACACNRGPDCAFNTFRRLCHEKLQARSIGPKRKRARSKPHTISPTSTGQATNSRAASEGHLDEITENDDNSVSGSARSKPPSRDRTPARLGSLDTPAILTGLTARDKRKAEQIEKIFQQEEQQPPRKKKKSIADGAMTSNSTKSKSRSTANHEKANGASDRRYVDAGTSAHKAGSPASATSPASIHSTANVASRHPSVASDSRHSSSSASRNYCDAAVQTEADQSNNVSTSRPPRRVMSLTMRLMRQRKRDSLLTQQRSASASLDAPIKSSQSSPSAPYKELPLASPTSADADAVMVEAPPIAANSGDISSGSSKGNGTEPVATPIKTDSPKLRVQMPPVPAFSCATAETPTTTPMSTNDSVQSPSSSTIPPSPLAPSGGNGVTATAVTAASPVKEKKKLDLSGYMKRKAEKAAMEAAAAAESPADMEHPSKSSVVSDVIQLHGTTNGDDATDSAAVDTTPAPTSSN
ncbi:SET domain-containing protein 3 [Gnomoniopsis sp. IMI 355080]|nr:SET domain-containing protein 3 [Gnomoniopsis sp. IMI 355080]